MGKTIFAICVGCRVHGIHLVCSRCGNVWHCVRKPGRWGVPINRCELCGKLR